MSDGRQTPSPASVVADLAKAHIAARCLHVIASCGVADALGAQAATPAELAAKTGLDADALRRMLRLLAAHGIFAERGDTYVHNEASTLLRADTPGSLRSYVRMTGMPAFWDGFTALEQAARSGQPARSWAALLEYFAAHPEESAFFNEAMVAKSRGAVAAVVDAYDFSDLRTIADIGGGRGHLLRAVLERAPSARGILFELPHVIGELGADEHSPRIVLAAGDFFADGLPAADAYLLMDLLHDWTDADAARILAGIRRAAPDGARVLIVETLVAEAPGPQFGKTLDIIMLAITGGRERTPSEHSALLQSAGFRLRTLRTTASDYSIVEAVAV